MAKVSFEEAAQRFMVNVVEMRDMIGAFEARVAADDWADEAEMLTAIEALGRAGARVYNAEKTMAGPGPFSLRDEIRDMRSR